MSIPEIILSLTLEIKSAIEQAIIGIDKYKDVDLRYQPVKTCYKNALLEFAEAVRILKEMK